MIGSLELEAKTASIFLTILLEDLPVKTSRRHGREIKRAKEKNYLLINERLEMQTKHNLY